MLLQLVAGFISRRPVILNWRCAICALIAISAMSFALFSSPSRAATCDIKPHISDVGRFKSDPIDEASGLALAPDGQSFFVTNDSGDKPRFFQTRLTGEIIGEFRMIDETGGSKVWKAFDVEALAVGPCPGKLVGDCVAVADIGDNREKRKSIEIGFFRIDSLPKPSSAVPITSVDAKLDLKLKLKYPDGARNAEGFAILSRKFGLIVTKEQDRKARATRAAGVYVINFETSEMERVATWDVPTWVGDQGLSALVTDLSVDVAGPNSTIRVLLLTYQDAFELLVRTDLPSPSSGKKQWPPPAWSIESRSRIHLAASSLPALQQQETITYDAQRTGFYYSTEVPFAAMGAGSAPLRRAEKVACP